MTCVPLVGDMGCVWIDFQIGCGMRTLKGPELEDDISWNDKWENTRQPFRCRKGKLSQFKILNRLYYTPSQLQKMGIRKDSRCIKCGAVE